MARNVLFERCPVLPEQIVMFPMEVKNINIASSSQMSQSARGFPWNLLLGSGSYNFSYYSGHAAHVVDNSPTKVPRATVENLEEQVEYTNKM